jgi:hypothetical protein
VRDTIGATPSCTWGAVEHSAIRSSPTATLRAYCSARSLDTAVFLRVIQRSRRCRGPSHGRASLAASRQRRRGCGRRRRL